MEDHLKKQMIYDHNKPEEISNSYSLYTSKSGMSGIKIKDTDRFRFSMIKKFGQTWQKDLLSHKQYIRHYTFEQLYKVSKGLIE